ncbi:MAG: DnaJ domain-containing protein [bacterium]|nr:hypothetical protein [Deltaproteobacteria bacterium]MCP4908755.1 DnaJ domain-containing protein [bacterium]
MFERTDPRTLLKGLILVAIVYLVLPHDLFPDYFGIPGRIDDVLIMAWLVWFYRHHLRQYEAGAAERASSRRPTGADTGPNATGGTERPNAFDPYEILGVARSASSDAIRDAYRSRMREYHPDKVAHLGEELRALAHEKSQQIQRAYRQLGD